MHRPVCLCCCILYYSKLWSRAVLFVGTNNSEEHACPSSKRKWPTLVFGAVCFCIDLDCRRQYLTEYTAYGGTAFQQTPVPLCHTTQQATMWVFAALQISYLPHINAADICIYVCLSLFGFPAAQIRQTRGQQRFMMWPAHILIFIKFKRSCRFFMHNIPKKSWKIRWKLFLYPCVFVQWKMYKSIKEEGLWRYVLLPMMLSWVSNLARSLFWFSQASHRR
jgi:hypothetical protein